ncbi:MAG TPA: hypothetical protein VHX38_03040 [Pseudonocardiaceae bacterium]|jgi:hypothetical protein|nr:hypothetical protein [Pseudonocardiaceae bacterium]
MNTTITVHPAGGTANLGVNQIPMTAAVKAAPKTPLASGAGDVRVSKDGTWRYVREGRVAVQHQPTGEWMWDELDRMQLGFTSMAEARRFTFEVDAQALADSTPFDGDPDCRCIRACACGSTSTDPLD